MPLENQPKDESISSSLLYHHSKTLSIIQNILSTCDLEKLN